MTAQRAARLLANASAALVHQHDIAGTLSEILEACVDALHLDACGIVVGDVSGRLELLSASSHQVGELELYESQSAEGPCLDAWTGNASISVSTGAEATRTWDTFGPAMIRAGFQSAHACPLRWDGRALGAMNLFRKASSVFSEEEQIIAQGFADIATLVVIHTDRLSVQTVAIRVAEALESRTLVEQAKGVLSYRLGVDMEEAYTILGRIAVEGGVSLTRAAQDVLNSAKRHRGT
ncbi:GAF and ANTAR domain-containing protein [soil metagenome]